MKLNNEVENKSLLNNFFIKYTKEYVISAPGIILNLKSLILSSKLCLNVIYMLICTFNIFY